MNKHVFLSKLELIGIKKEDIEYIDGLLLADEVFDINDMSLFKDDGTNELNDKWLAKQYQLMYDRGLLDELIIKYGSSLGKFNLQGEYERYKLREQTTYNGICIGSEIIKDDLANTARMSVDKNRASFAFIRNKKFIQGIVLNNFINLNSNIYNIREHYNCNYVDLDIIDGVMHFKESTYNEGTDCSNFLLINELRIHESNGVKQYTLNKVYIDTIVKDNEYLYIRCISLPNKDNAVSESYKFYKYAKNTCDFSHGMY